MSDQRLVFIGLTGLAGSGKTTVANNLAPSVGKFIYGDFGDGFPSETFWHYTLANPLYSMANIKRLTEGADREDRVLYGLHDELSDVLGRHLSYRDFVAFVERVAAADAGGEYDAKPRKFLIDVGDWCREVDPDCFVSLVIRKTRQHAEEIKREYEMEELDPPTYFAVVSDIRYPNERDELFRAAELVLVKLKVSRETADTRILGRDDTPMLQEHWDHPTEAGFPDEECDIVLDTDEMSIEEVVGTIREYILPVQQEVTANG